MPSDKPVIGKTTVADAYFVHCTQTRSIVHIMEDGTPFVADSVLAELLRDA